ncbi:MAG: DUF4340 domain-containing protein [Planctomycetia bacterium]|nr:DUF4340 domain-containing protein [Planctomycetia bacterium]
MNENAKTGIFCGAAILFLALAVVMYWTRAPASSGPVVDDLIVAVNFDPLKATRLQIVSFDEKLGRARRFEVALVDNVWCIPSHDNYPTDSEQNPLAGIAGSLRGLKQLSSVSANRSDHKKYGVVEPDPDKSQAGVEGVGTMLTMSDKDGKPIVNLIIGKEVTGKPDQRYVRDPKRDVVYLAKVSTEKLSAKFEDWINPDLLKVNAWDLKKVIVLDYSIDLAARKVDDKDPFELTYQDSAAQARWTLSDLQPGEELIEARLNEMVANFANVRVVGVVPKPKGLIRFADGLQLDPAEQETLGKRGIYLFQDPQGRPVVKCAQGERRIIARDGVEYTLRFGAVAGGESGEAAAAEGPVTTNRYLLVSVRFNDEAFTRPKLKPLPGDESEIVTYTAQDLAAIRQFGLMTEPDMIALRKKVEDENKRLQDDYEAQIKPGRDKADRLSRRFANWYYVISEDVYKKIHITREEIIKKPGEPAKPASGALPPGASSPQPKNP